MNIFSINNLLNLSLYLLSASTLIFISAVIYKYFHWYRQFRNIKDIEFIKKRLHFIRLHFIVRFCIALFSLALTLGSIGYYFQKYYLFDLFSPFLFIIGLSIFFWNLSYNGKLIDPNIQKNLQDKNLHDLYHFITREEFEKELKECRFILENPEVRKNLIAALTIELKSSDNREKLDVLNRSEVLKQAENISMQTVKEKTKELKEVEEQLNKIKDQIRAGKENLSSPTTQED